MYIYVIIKSIRPRQPKGIVALGANLLNTGYVIVPTPVCIYEHLMDKLVYLNTMTKSLGFLNFPI
jgi:hypothetical protein